MPKKTSSHWQIRWLGVSAHIYKTSVALKLFSVLFAVITLVIYATPIAKVFLSQEVYENYLLIIILSYTTIVIIFEAFFHFAFAACIALLLQKKINPLLMLSALFTIGIISLLGYKATEGVKLLPEGRGGVNEQLEQLVGKQQRIEKQYQIQQKFINKQGAEQRQQIVKDHVLEKIKADAHPYEKYHIRKSNQAIRQQKADALAKLDANLARKQATLIKQTVTKRKQVSNALAAQQEALKQTAAYNTTQFKKLSLVWAIFSILSSMIMGVYEGQTKSDVTQTTKQGKTTARQSTQTKANVEGFWSDRLLGFIQTNNLPLDCLNKLLPTPQDVSNQATPTPKPVPHVTIQPTTALWQEVADLFRQVDDEGKPCYSINKAKDLINAKYNTTIARHQFEKVRKHTLANKS